MSDWSADEDAILRAHYVEHGRCWAGWESLLPGRSQNSLASRARRLGLYVTDRHEEFVRRGPKPKPRPRPQEDPMERRILRLMAGGMTASEIDKAHGWVPGRTTQILTERWKREDR